MTIFFQILKNSSFTTLPTFDPVQLVQLMNCRNNITFSVLVASEL
jgi:hypothetical protein